MAQEIIIFLFKQNFIREPKNLEDVLQVMQPLDWSSTYHFDRAKIIFTVCPFLLQLCLGAPLSNNDWRNLFISQEMFKHSAAVPWLWRGTELELSPECSGAASSHLHFQPYQHCLKMTLPLSTCPCQSLRGGLQVLCLSRGGLRFGWKWFQTRRCCRSQHSSLKVWDESHNEELL